MPKGGFTQGIKWFIKNQLKQRRTAMSKEIKEKAPKPTYTKKQVFMAVLPWAIIVIATVGFIGVVTGWTLRSSDISRVHAEAQVVSQQILKLEK
jgi:cell division septal protein FtsQ